jgi:hypothetical protein
MNKFQTNTILRAQDEPRLLTEWEEGFIDNLAGLPEETELSEKQNEIINRIRKKLDFG